jgi:ATP-dependent protease ClpP protease subunit
MKVIILFLLSTKCLGLIPDFSRRNILSNLIYTTLITKNEDNDYNVNTDNSDSIEYFNEELIDNKRSHNIIQQNNNNIYFYSPVTQDSCFELTKRLLDIDSTSQTFNLQYGMHSPPINLHIQSEGGSLLHALYVTDVIQNLKTPVHTYIDGFAASAATLLSVVGDKRFITKNSLMLIHQLSGANVGKYNQMEDEMENLDNIMNIVINMYLNNSVINKNKLIEILKKDIWLDAKTCLDYGLVDTII